MIRAIQGSASLIGRPEFGGPSARAGQARPIWAATIASTIPRITLPTLPESFYGRIIEVRGDKSMYLDVPAGRREPQPRLRGWIQLAGETSPGCAAAFSATGVTSARAGWLASSGASAYRMAPS